MKTPVFAAATFYDHAQTTGAAPSSPVPSGRIVPDRSDMSSVDDLGLALLHLAEAVVIRLEMVARSASVFPSPQRRGRD